MISSGNENNSDLSAGQEYWPKSASMDWFCVVRLPVNGFR